ncbi:VOC family protein [Arsenicibacter rosenii]|uniref:VOC domain-containing protein n=1 Tax=Arsenicibacter rosenii TaxID=1750698 RepID=A0A1S2VBU3_9BACT|nr:VOC family protein [Arsenicibacter rosenii]OIN56211.1 hypothetical protein BLX24_25775 [Arsenicibacter rosenii]
MATMIFVNLPVKDLNRSIDFFTGIGFACNAQFTDEKAACIVVSETIYVMLLTAPFFKTFTNKELADATSVTETIVCLSADSREQVDELVDKAMAAGASPSNEASDQGFMYYRSFQDPDGHMWEVMWMDPAAVQAQQAAAETTTA